MSSAPSPLWIPQGARADSTYTKAPAPKLGPQFGSWAGRDLTYLNFPGGAALAFDLSKLTLTDYRTMRSHYQVNASQSLMMFMLHQIDWQIDCDDARVARRVDDVMRPIWTRLVRGLSQAFWSGFSPNVIEWDNDGPSKSVIVSKIKDLVPEECRVNWEIVEGSPSTPGAVPQRLYEYNGIQQLAYGVGAGFAYIEPQYSIWYPVLMENGNYYGRKLLKPAFIPWFFSQLIHLFTNRYYERFGEPTPIGRADFESTVIDANGNEIDGKSAMENILSNLRNRGVVVLPSDRVPVGNGTTSDYAYSIEYLESQMRGADWERYLLRLDEEISLGTFTPLSALRVGENGSMNTVQVHLQCVAPETPILCADLIWRAARDCRVGQEIIAFDEDADVGHGKGINARSYRTAVIQANMLGGEKPSLRISTDIGDSVTASVDHPWLVWRRHTMRVHGDSNMGWTWVETKELRIGDKLAHLGRPWKRDQTHEAGWLAGMFDGEGSLMINRHLDRSKPGRGVQIALAQNEGEVFDRLKASLTDRGYQVGLDDMGGRTCKQLRVNGGFLGAMRFMGEIAPMRLMTKARSMWEGRGVRRGQSCEFAIVTEIEDVGVRQVSSIQTSTGTFITGGYLTHNTYLWQLNAFAGDWKEYIDRYLVQRIVDFNFGTNAPRAQWVPKKFGKDNAETLRAMVMESVRTGDVKPDAYELGQAIGITLEDVSELVRPINALGEDPNNPTASPTGPQPATPAISAGVPAKGTPVKDSRSVRGSHGPARIVPKTGDSGVIRHKIVDRVTKQFQKAKFDGLVEFQPDVGFQRQVADLLGDDEASAVLARASAWAADAYPVVDRGSEFEEMFGRVLEDQLA